MRSDMTSRTASGGGSGVTSVGSQVHRKACSSQLANESAADASEPSSIVTDGNGCVDEGGTEGVRADSGAPGVVDDERTLKGDGLSKRSCIEALNLIRPTPDPRVSGAFGNYHYLRSESQ